MISPDIKILMEKMDSRYTLVITVAKRARQLTDGDPKMTWYRSDKAVTLAIHEIAERKIGFNRDIAGNKAAISTDGGAHYGEKRDPGDEGGGVGYGADTGAAYIGDNGGSEATGETEPGGDALGATDWGGAELEGDEGAEDAEDAEGAEDAEDAEGAAGVDAELDGDEGAAGADADGPAFIGADGGSEAIGEAEPGGDALGATDCGGAESEGAEGDEDAEGDEGAAGAEADGPALIGDDGGSEAIGETEPGGANILIELNGGRNNIDG